MEESLTVLLDTGVPHASIYMLEVDQDSRLGREMLAGGTRYYAGLVPTDDAMAQMYTRAIERLGEAESNNTRYPTLAGQGSSRGTTCATGSGGLTWGWGSMHPPWHCMQRTLPRPMQSRTNRGTCCVRQPSVSWENFLLAASGGDGVAFPARQHEEAWFLG